MATGTVRQRGRGGPGTPQWMALGVAGLVIVGLTFALGMLVGRQWARQTQPAVAAAPTQKPTAAPRRGGLTDTGPERAPQIEEKLTFYQTLTAPLGPVPLTGKADATVKPATVARVRMSQERLAEPGSEATLPRKASAAGQESARPAPRQTGTPEQRQETGSDSPTPAPKGSQVAPGAERQDAGSEWTVQVGVFSSSEQAAGIKKHLAARGFEAQVTSVATEEGQVRYRVRVGAFKTRDEAVRTAERVRSERSVPTYVTAK